jgi:acyl-CoA synthetase (NDP forming)
LADHARSLGKPIVALRVGSSVQAQEAAVSHTASLVGSDAGARALLARLGIGQVETASDLIEVLKLLHVTGGLVSAQIASASCSGGEASLMADIGAVAGVTFPPLDQGQKAALRDTLGPKAALANPLDYNTYIWGNETALTACFSALAGGDQALTCVVMDMPCADRFTAPDYDIVLQAMRNTQQATGRRMAVISLMAEGLPEPVSEALMAEGIVPLCDMGTALRAIKVAAGASTYQRAQPVLLPRQGNQPRIFNEAEAKALLKAAGLRVPKSMTAPTAENAPDVAVHIGFPVVLKGEGVAHKTEAGAVILGLDTPQAVRAAALSMPCDSFLVEEMVTGTVAELLIGVTRDPAHGFVLTLGLGGILTELINDTCSLLVPASRDAVRRALSDLRTSALLTGYRGRASADLDAILDAVMALQDFVADHAADLHEIEINPLMCLPDGAVAADALIRMGEPR